ncbi:cobalt-precorrin-6A reductase [Streptomyces clavuligerus]|uniref:Cobalt-precorrin-6x reductase n=1 Tax=Streptomyces clavuligerus TaxID=1901 RepID=E2Q9U6_STRCL|nr:cobalt-precorrin-6A reductase [Streptomyces clavuligerus]ANW19523.1 cobalt-precorrin-6A reductase [Streptomyces clavuligerus]AXU14130.1 cobalt-precorrin-6A reductase [Streptomyces clavuligerus]EFG07673.1 cobalt-precorrin-6x reductase [Streptomyces clavuligerus]MBY6304120.1 cobalt-precorrin-6A reductase [Streptomyces clavuligerus]QCS06902.1 cobalt-precorrin-6A reductase [Streptomyces clavuligerus]
MHIVILGGTTEARRLAELLHDTPDLRLTSSLAGRVAAPRLPPGEVRVGGFGGAEGLAAWLRAHAVDLLIDATHPFARTMSLHAARAAAATRVPLLALRRPGWVREPGDDWHPVDSLAEASALLPSLGRRVFLTTGRTGLAAFAPGDGLWFLVRSVDPPEGPVPERCEVLLDRGPYGLDGERELLARHRIDVVVTKDSGGAATAPKLRAAREAGLPVVVVRRPPLPPGVVSVPDPESAAAWARTRMPSPPAGQGAVAQS